MSFVIHLVHLLATLDKGNPDSLGRFSFLNTASVGGRGAWQITFSGFFHIRENIIGLGSVGLRSALRPPERCSAHPELML